MSSIDTQTCDEGTDNVGWIQNGDWTMLSDIDLNGASRASVFVQPVHQKEVSKYV